MLMVYFIYCGTWSRTKITAFRELRPTIRRSRKIIYFNFLTPNLFIRICTGLSPIPGLASLFPNSKKHHRAFYNLTKIGKKIKMQDKYLIHND